jgi:tryptophan synthase alpha chain
VPALAQGVALIRFVTPTTEDARLKRIVAEASGYLYYVSVAGVTGTKAVPEEEVRAAMTRVRAATDLPCTVGFGIRSPEQAEAIARLADGVVVGSAIVSRVAANLELLREEGGRDKVVAEVLELVQTLAGSTHAARRGKVEA